MMFLHILANLDAIDASEAAKNGRETPRPHSVRFDLRPPSSLRPRSCIQTSFDRRCSSPDGKPGKVLSFQLKKGPSSSLSAFTQGSQRPVSRRAIVLHPRSASSRSSRIQDALNNTQSDRERASPSPTGITTMEPAFMDIDLEVPGLRIWRLEGTQLQPVMTNEYGFFHEGNAYIILKTVSQNERSLHFWLGSTCAEVDRKLIEDKAHLLDNVVSNAQIFSREIQSFESVVFMRLFTSGVVYIEGKHKTTVSKASIYAKKMYLVTGRKYPRASCVQPKREYLVSQNAVILDGHPRMYVWIGGDTNYVLRTKAIRLAKKIQHFQRKSRCHVIVMDESDVHLNDLFQKKFENQAFPAPSSNQISERGKENVKDDQQNIPDSRDNRSVLYRISGDRVLYDMPEAAKTPLKHCYLVKQDSYLLDRGPTNTLYIWVGSIANEEHVMHSLTRAKSFTTHNDYPETHSICRIRENYEPQEFKKCFYNWRDRLSKEMSLTKRYSVGNIGRALFSRTDRRTIATVKQCWSVDSICEHKGTTQMWVLADCRLVPWYHNGLFNNNKCYIILYNTATAEYPQTVLYYWMGSKSTKEDQSLIVQLVFEKSFELDNAVVLVRVLDGQEQKHFMTTMRNWIMVCDSEIDSEGDKSTQVYCVREFYENSMRIQQVRPSWASLNSSASYVILTDTSAFIWYGKLSGSTERESAKDLLGILCSEKMFSYEIITERKEPESILRLFGPREPYDMDYRPSVIDRRLPRLYCCHEETKTFEDIDDYLQEDLSEESIMVLDVFDQIFIWCGYKVENDRRKHLFDLAQAFISQDAAGRDLDNITVWILSQRHEPFAFSKYFKQWGALGYSGRHSYEVLRKRTRQENARIQIDEQAVDLSGFGRARHSYKTLLQAELPSDVDVTQKHLYLSEKQFKDHLKISKVDFYNSPEWKQRQILLATRLLYTSPISLPRLNFYEDELEGEE